MDLFELLNVSYDTNEEDLLKVYDLVCENCIDLRRLKFLREEYLKFKELGYERYKMKVKYSMEPDLSGKLDWVFKNENKEVPIEHKPEKGNVIEVDFDKSKVKTFNTVKKKINWKITKKVIIAGMVIAIGITGIKLISNTPDYVSEPERNVCISYVVGSGQGYSDLDKFLSDGTIIHQEVKNGPGSFRGDNLYMGDVFVGRVTLEDAEKLVEMGSAKIISPEEAIELINENGNRAIGELGKLQKGEETSINFEDIGHLKK